MVLFEAKKHERCMYEAENRAAPFSQDGGIGLRLMEALKCREKKHDKMPNKSAACSACWNIVKVARKGYTKH